MMINKKLFTTLLIIIVILSTAFICVSCSSEKSNKDGLSTFKEQEYWPTDGWRIQTPEDQGMDSKVLADMVNSINKSGKSVNSITIIRNGYLVNEAYFYPYQKGLKHFMNSATKSITSALVGIAIDEGYIKSTDESVLNYFPDLEIANVDRHKKDLKISNLLSMTTGIDWDFANNTSTNNMLLSQDWTQFTLDQPMKGKPGKTFNYCNGASHLLSAIVQKTTGKSLAELALEKFKPMGIKDIYWGSSPENVSSGYTGLYMLPDDAAKIGYLYLNKGNWDGQQLISEKWIEASTKRQVKADWNPILPGYGYMWWINRFGGYCAFGQGGDYIFVVPELNLVVVFTGGMYNVNEIFYPGELMEKYIIPSVKSDAPLKSDQKAAESLEKALDKVQEAPSPENESSLPEIAGKISGKTFAMDDATTLLLSFTDKECIVYQNSECLFTAGMDNVYRVSETEDIYEGFVQYLFGSIPQPSHIAAKGCWLDENTLQITTNCLEESFESVFTVHFEGDRVEIKNESILYSEKINTGELTK